jgi:heptosyltransferase-1
MRILVVKLSSFGDVVHAMPALSDLAAARPDVEIDWLVEEGFASIAALHPSVGEIITVADRRLRWPPYRWPALIAHRNRLRKKLQARRYNLVVDLQGLLKSVATARLAIAPIAGYDANSIREPAASRFYDRTFDVSRDLHAVERNRCLLAAALGYEVPAGKGSFGLTKGEGGRGGLPGRYAILIHSASWPSKLWPEREWQRLVRHLADRGLPGVLPWGSEEEKARAKRIAASGNAIVLSERLGGAELAGVIGGAVCAVGLDSGLMHLATALGVPGVWLFGPTDPGLTGPYGDKQTVVQSTNPAAPCRTRDCAHAAGGKTCMERVDFERVAEAVDRLAAESGNPRPFGKA